MAKLRVGVVFGGCSSEYHISIRSAQNIYNCIDLSSFELTMFLVNKQCVWYVNDGSCDSIDMYYRSTIYKKKGLFLTEFNKNICFIFFKDKFYKFIRIGKFPSRLDVDVVFPIIHGRVGEDGVLQGFLQMNNLPFVGSNVLGSAIGMDKDIAKRLLCSAGLRVAPSLTLIKNVSADMSFEYFVNILGIPLFVKPVNQGSSIGVSKVFNRQDFMRSLVLAFSFSNKVLVETCIIGQELTCGILGNENPQASLCGEIILSNGSFYSYDNKYSERSYAQIMIPAKISNILSLKVRNISLRAFQILNCIGMARVDLFLTKDNQVIINEINTLPGFTVNSMYPKLWEASGLSCTKLITKLINLALDLHQRI